MSECECICEITPDMQREADVLIDLLCDVALARESLWEGYIMGPHISVGPYPAQTEGNPEIARRVRERLDTLVAVMCAYPWIPGVGRRPSFDVFSRELAALQRCDGSWLQRTGEAYRGDPDWLGAYASAFKQEQKAEKADAAMWLAQSQTPDANELSAAAELAASEAAHTEGDDIPW